MIRAVLAATLALAGCGRSQGVEDRDLGGLVVAPRTEDKAIEIDRAAKDPAELGRALKRAHHAWGLPPHTLSISTATTVEEGGKVVDDLSDHTTIELGDKGAFHALYSNSADYGREGVRANIIHPGLVDSPQNEALLSKLVPDVEGWLKEFTTLRQCLPRLATAREVGELAAFLLGEKARSITGQAIFIDGGTTTLLWNNEP